MAFLQTVPGPVLLAHNLETATLKNSENPNAHGVCHVGVCIVPPSSHTQSWC